MDNHTRKQGEIEPIASAIVDACVRVHRGLGPGLLESTYQACLAYELTREGLKVECQLTLPVQYREVDISTGYRIDMLVEDAIIIENKSVQALQPIHTAQLMTYLKLSHRQLGFLINWNVRLIKNGIKRIIVD